MPKAQHFSKELAIALVKIDGVNVLHVVDTQTQFSSAIMPEKETVEGVWAAFLECWAT